MEKALYVEVPERPSSIQINSSTNPEVLKPFDRIPIRITDPEGKQVEGFTSFSTDKAGSLFNYHTVTGEACYFPLSIYELEPNQEL